MVNYIKVQCGTIRGCGTIKIFRNKDKCLRIVLHCGTIWGCDTMQVNRAYKMYISCEVLMSKIYHDTLTIVSLYTNLRWYCIALRVKWLRERDTRCMLSVTVLPVGRCVPVSQTVGEAPYIVDFSTSSSLASFVLLHSTDLIVQHVSKWFLL